MSSKLSEDVPVTKPGKGTFNRRNESLKIKAKATKPTFLFEPGNGGAGHSFSFPVNTNCALSHANESFVITRLLCMIQ